MVAATPGPFSGPVSGPPSGPPLDPTLETLVPQPSTRRNVVLGALAVVLLAGTWFLAPLLRPALVVTGGGLRSTADPMPLSLARVTATGPITVEAVGDARAAVVVGAWLVPEADGRADLTDLFAAVASPEDLLRASGIDPAGAALPQALADGETAWLMVAWRLTDCTATGDVEWGPVTVRSPLGVRRDLDIVGAGQAIMIDDALRAACR
ncbi:hypothetical protein [Actinotalea fermentans]|uniref:Uncharacterized protein n=1 Tax=Actinotalea fermentans TaxID=43671 RepID=A0A511Z105_9CELL|nr:hypothetical protein [Actinotalea fermentans]KGM14777.1 hypothetical protein N867_16080 [Actinotalea fermentans ATCC 43279 = JCM 9966 = DSM 3133]GEN81119.1 hypothetical protein AFE02nite_28530 [Actinotalea fermentans]